jgi:hypothetical protein
MISSRIRRRTSRQPEEERSPGLVSRTGSKLRSIGHGIFFQSIDPVKQTLPQERPDHGPFGQVGPNTAQIIRKSVSAIGRTAASPFGALVTVTVADNYVRLLTARGNRVRAWGERYLPTGVVQHGLIVDEQTFIDTVNELLQEVTRNGKLNGQKVAVAITGRNMVQRRMTVFVDEDITLADAIVEASTDSMSIRPEEMQLDWDAEELEVLDEEEIDSQESEDDAESPSSSESEDTRQAQKAAEQVEEGLGLEHLEIVSGPEPEGDPFDVYALAIHKHVIRRNLRTISEFSNRFAGVQPKIMALAAAVNTNEAVVVDIDSGTLITSVVREGLPEVIREVGIDANLTDPQREQLIVTQVSRAVAYYDSIFPEEPFQTTSRIYVTGQLGGIERVVNAALEKLPYSRAEMPKTVRAPEDFSFEKYAANVGLAIVSGKRFWQRTPVPLLSIPKFDFRPAQYRPRPLPIKAAMKVAAIIILGLGLFGGYQQVDSQSRSNANSEAVIGSLEQRVELRSLKLERTREAREALDTAKARTERLIAANEAIQDRASGYGDTVAIISALTTDGIRLTSIDDDGSLVLVEAEANDFSKLLEYIAFLELVPEFDHLQIVSLEAVSGDQTGEPSEIMAGPAQVESVVKMSVEIDRIQIEDSQPAEDVSGELAVTSEE